VPRITAPLTTGKWKAGDTIRFTGSATDAQDGTVPASRLGWSVVLGHCTTTGCHEHPLASRDGVATGTIAAPDHEAPSYVEFTLTATDAFGATASVVRRVDPQTATITLASDYPGLMLAAGSGQSTPTVFTQLWVVNSQLQLNAPLTQARGQFLYTFRSWSDGGAATHTIRVPAANTTYTASYRERCTTATYPDAVGADDPLVVWRLGESGGAAAADASGHARPGTYVGGVSLGQPGALVGDVNRSVSLDGNDDRVIRNPLQGIAPGEISADLWVRTTSTTKDAGILSYATTSSADELLLRDPRALVVYVKGTRVDTGLVLNDGRWHHLAVTWRSAGGELRVYQNGTLRFSGTVRAGAALTPNGSLVLGQDQDSVGGGFDTGQAFAGQLDDAAIYPTALGANRIQAHHRAGFAPGCATASAVSRFLAPSERVPDPR
jgi:hypothetical protein